jgi:hypothetical protein
MSYCVSSLLPVVCWRAYILLCFPLYLQYKTYALQQTTGGKEENTIRHMPSNKQLEVKRKHNKTYALQQVTGGKEENTIRHEGIFLIVFSSLPPVVCWRAYVLLCFPLYLQLLVGGHMSYCVFLFTSSCLLEGICLIVFSSLPPVT